MLQIIRNHKGLSLIELIVSMALLGMIISAIFAFGQFNYRSYNNIEDSVELQSQLRTAMNKITREISLGTTLYEHSYNPSYIDGDASNHHIEKVIFQRDNHSQLTYYILIYRDGTLYNAVTTSPSPQNIEVDTAIASYIDYLMIDYNEKQNIITIKMEASKGNSRHKLENKVFLRNAMKKEGIL